MIFNATLTVPFGLRITRDPEGKTIVASVKTSGGAREWNGSHTPLIHKGDEILSLTNSTGKANVGSASDVISFVKAHEAESIVVEFRRCAAKPAKESPKEQTYFAQLQIPLGLCLNADRVVTGIDVKGSVAQWNLNARKKGCREVRMKDRLVAFYQDEERVAVSADTDDLTRLEALPEGTKVELELISHTSPLWSMLASAARLSVAAYRQAKDNTAHLLNISCAHDFTPLPVWLLGRCYDYDESQDEQVRIQAFQEDFKRRLWFTYRCGFPRIGTANITSDTGWGCMLRSAQMIMAQGFMYHYLGRDWVCKEPGPPPQYYQIIRWFLDLPGDRYPYSIHNMLEHAKVLGKPVDSWHGPWAVCVMLQKCLEAQNPPDLSIVVCDDGTVYKDQIIRLCTPSADSVVFHTFSPPPDLSETNNKTNNNSINSNSNLFTPISAATTNTLHCFSPSAASSASASMSSLEEKSPSVSPFPSVCNLPFSNSPSLSPSIVNVSSSVASPFCSSSLASSSSQQIPPFEDIALPPSPSIDTSATTTAATVTVSPDVNTATSTNTTPTTLTPASTNMLSDLLGTETDAIITGTSTTTELPTQTITSQANEQQTTDTTTSQQQKIVEQDEKLSLEEKSQHSEPSTSSTPFPPSLTSPDWKAILIFIPLRLGVKNLNPLYVDSLIRLFQFPQALGIIGGRPSSSLYFIGSQGTRLFYLDPHTTQPFVSESSSPRSSSSSSLTPSPPPPFPTGSFHCSTVQSINIYNLDPSMALAFYCRTRAELEDLFERVQLMDSEVTGGSLPVFATADKMPAYLQKGASKRVLARQKSTEIPAPRESTGEGEGSGQRFDDWESEPEISDEKTMGDSGSEGDDFVLIDDA